MERLSKREFLRRASRLPLLAALAVVEKYFPPLKSPEAGAERITYPCIETSALIKNPESYVEQTVWVRRAMIEATHVGWRKSRVLPFLWEEVYSFRLYDYEGATQQSLLAIDEIPLFSNRPPLKTWQTPSGKTRTENPILIFGAVRSFGSRINGQETYYLEIRKAFETDLSTRS